MKKIFFLLFLSSTIVDSDELNSDFYEPSPSNSYQGRLLYNPVDQDYPIDLMRKFCEPYTGIDTAQIKCKKHDLKGSMACTYKCSMHWSITE